MQPEDEIIERQHGQPRPGSASAPPAASSGAVAARGGDQRRDEQRQRDERHDQVARAGADRRAPRRACRRRASPGRPSSEDERSAPAAPAEARPEQQDRERRAPRRARRARGTRTAPAPSRRTAPCGRSARAGTPSKPPCSCSATNSRLIPSIAANSSVTHSTPAARSPASVVAVEPEVEERRTS